MDAIDIADWLLNLPADVDQRGDDRHRAGDPALRRRDGRDNGDGTVTYTNQVTSHPTQELMEFDERNGVTFEEAAAARQAASGDLCRRETPLYAASIARHARAKTGR
ncbi:hypothetical protein ABTY98_00815 [Streptomyces sp. NPDC096040]|uniref:hypothetical protein n=1 Tax=Streptomyces sp. NPDC096040 TaxID=3155541 RepID=UPI00331B735E